ncbi:MAG TPA: MBL fold metallo-hydrolase [Deltaproteobacteria bacterium]|nr:MBL fold metallo-hydrolase [Deltaproteobacteria bacterium]HPR55013.1 MBL fold metallo-hydrolase [Deltaproteobacteria bacterium]HXK46350.1 MBL fold metallo-hydrolase [Deltaproteobacteria bacterium]
MPVSLRWMGTAHIELSHDGRVVLVDPYLTRPPKSAIFFRRLRPDPDAARAYAEGLDGTVKAIIASHTHFDHVLDIPELARRTGSTVIGSPSLDALMGISGLPGRITIARPREAVHLVDGLTITMIPSIHGLIMGRTLLMEGDIDRTLTPPLRTHRYRLGAMYTVKVELGGMTFLHVGSAGFLEEELAGHTCDVLFLCAAGWKNTPGYPERVVDILRPSCVVPIHYDDFSLPLLPGKDFRVLKSADITRFIEKVKRTGSSLEVRQIEPCVTTSF